MEILAQQIVTGVMTGSLYAIMALSLALIFRATKLINFGQGEMATFTTFIFWSLIQGVPYPVAFLLAIPIGFAIGAVTHVGVVRLVEGRDELNAVIVTLGLFMIFNSLSLSIYGPVPHFFNPPVSGSPFDVAGISIPKYSVFVFVVAMGMAGLLYIFFQRTKLGLALRTTSMDRTAAELMGIPTGVMLTLGWGLAAAIGAVAGILVAPIAVLTPNMAFFLLILAFASGVLGGMDNPAGVVAGGLIVGVTQNLVGVYLDDIVGLIPSVSIDNPNSYRDVVAIALIIGVLTLKPRGLFGGRTVEKP